MDKVYRTIVIGVVSQLLGVITMVIPIDSHQQPPLPHPHAGEVLGNGCCVAPLAPSSPANWKPSPTSRPQPQQWGKIMAADSWCNAGPWNSWNNLPDALKDILWCFFPTVFFLCFLASRARMMISMARVRRWSRQCVRWRNVSSWCCLSHTGSSPCWGGTLSAD